jgi:hypothetical protein
MIGSWVSIRPRLAWRGEAGTKPKSLFFDHGFHGFDLDKTNTKGIDGSEPIPMDRGRLDQDPYLCKSVLSVVKNPVQARWGQRAPPRQNSPDALSESCRRSA